MKRTILRWSIACCALLLAGLGTVALGAAPAASRSTRPSQRPSTGLHVIPFPGTPDASPGSQIIFSSLSPAQIRSVSVWGSLSGSHTGRLTALPDRAGTAFVPSNGFTSGELVTVQAALNSPAAGTASGDPHATTLHFSFGVARESSPASASSVAHTARGGPNRHFKSAPRLRPPVVSASANPDRRSGEIFLTPNHSTQRGPMILDSQGRMLWFRPLRGMAYNLEVQRYRRHPVLTWWQGGRGEDVIMNRSYRIVKILRAANGYSADVHEFQLTRQGTALIDSFVPVQMNLTSVGGSSNGTVQDCVIQELDVRTGRLLWEWHTLGHIPISDSYRRPTNGKAFSYFHLNSIQQLRNGNLLISGANTWGVYEISRSTGRVIWELGGKHSDFRVRRRARFEWQHDPRLHRGVLSVFDDAGLPQKEFESSAKFLRLNTRTMTASLVRRYNHQPPLLAARAGSVQVLPNRDVLVGWGSSSRFDEYSPNGRQIFSASFSLGVYSYRAYRFQWVGHPRTRPSMAIAPGRPFTVYASWNGATQVASWRVLGGSHRGSLRWLAVVPWRGFETAIRVTGRRPRYLAVQAVGRSGRVLGTSRRRGRHP